MDLPSVQNLELSYGPHTAFRYFKNLSQRMLLMRIFTHIPQNLLSARQINVPLQHDTNLRISSNSTIQQSTALHAFKIPPVMISAVACTATTLVCFSPHSNSRQLSVNRHPRAIISIARTLQTFISPPDATTPNLTHTPTRNAGGIRILQTKGK